MNKTKQLDGKSNIDDDDSVVSMTSSSLRSNETSI